MKAWLAIGIILLIALGFVALAYFASPMRILMLAYVPHNVDITVPIAGGLSLACGIGDPDCVQIVETITVVMRIGYGTV